MSVPALPATLSPSLSGRDAVTDALYRCVTALDADDMELFKSAFTSDASFDLNGTVMNGFDAIVKDCYTNISKMDTAHFITNQRIHLLDGDSKAQMTCSALAQHYRPSEGSKSGSSPLLAGSLYWLDLVKDSKDGLWKIKDWKMKIVWGQGDWGVFGGSS